MDIRAMLCRSRLLAAAILFAGAFAGVSTVADTADKLPVGAVGHTGQITADDSSSVASSAPSNLTPSNSVQSNSESSLEANRAKRINALKDKPDAKGAEKASSGAYIMQLVMSLVVVLLAIAVLGWLVKRMNRLPKRAGGQMQVLSSMALGARERAVLVQVGDTQMLLGVSPGRVSTLHVFDEPVVDATDGGDAPTAANFASILNHLGKGGRKS